jgi:hypothetical protein
MNLIMQCYYMRSKILKSEAFIKEFLDYTKKVRSDEEALIIREQEISRREKAIERTLQDILKMKNQHKKKFGKSEIQMQYFKCIRRTE